VTTGTRSKSFFTGAGMEKRSLTREESLWPGASSAAPSRAVFDGMGREEWRIEGVRDDDLGEAQALAQVRWWLRRREIPERKRETRVSGPGERSAEAIGWTVGGRD
jgi:hypothetical protein